MTDISKEELEHLYVVENKSMNEISKITDISVGKIHRLIHDYKIPVKPQHQGFKGKHHTDEAKKKISNIHSGKYVTDETRRKMSESKIKGGIGHKKKRTDGYIAVYFPDHTQSNSSGYIMEHDLVMECIIGRRLNDDECVHHINFIRDDNRKENLKLMTKTEHMSLHAKLRHLNKEEKYNE